MVDAQAQEIEKGKNFDRVLVSDNNGFKTFKWTSTPERVLSDSWEWKDFIYSETVDTIRFESKRVAFEFDKSSCAFKLYEAGRIGIKQPVIESFSHTLKINRIEQTGLPCNVSTTQNEKGIQMIVDRGKMKVVYDLIYHSGLEWTFDIVNNEAKDNIPFTVTDTCLNCAAERIFVNEDNSTVIEFGNYILDTKNDVHNRLKDYSSIDSSFVINYEKELLDKERLIIDPTLSSGDLIEDGDVRDANNNDTCDAGFEKRTGNDNMAIGTQQSGVTDCWRGYVEWDISSIPDGAGVILTEFIFDIMTVTNWSDTCEFYEMTNQPTTSSASTVFTDAKDGVLYASDDTLCDTTGNNKVIDLGSDANSRVETQLTNGDWFAIGISVEPESIGASEESFYIDSEDVTPGTPIPTLEITYYEPVPIDAVTDLTSPEQSFTAVSLDWSQPNLNGITLQGYQINYTTPHSQSVNTVIENDTASSTTSYSVTGLDISTDYSFRVGVWAVNLTSGQGSSNMSGNILNTTTLGVVGNFTQNYTNPDIIDIRFEEIEVNETTTRLNVTYPNTFTNFNCQFDYSLQQAETEHNNVSSLVVDSTYNETSFLFVNATYDIITANCWDLATNNSGSYVLTLGNIPIITQIQNFQAGVYGTAGDFGAIDLVVLSVLIVSMIGFNRVNETVGAFFAFALIGALAWFEIIAFPTIVFGGIAVVLMLVIASTKKD